MLFRLATGSKLRWSPSTFWAATICELEMAMEGLEGNFRGTAGLDRERIRRIVAMNGPTKSLKSKPGVVTLGANGTAFPTR